MTHALNSLSRFAPAGILFAPTGRRGGPAGEHHRVFGLQQNPSVLPGFRAEPQPLLAREL